MKKLATTTKLAFLIVSLLTIYQFIWWYPRLPDVVPSGFDANGHVNRSMTKPAYFITMAAVHALLMIGFPLFAFFSHRMPDAMINIPHKKFWLADERREDSLSYLNAVLLQIGTLTMLFMGSLFHLSCGVAIKARNKITPEFYWLFGGYLVITVLYLIWVNIRFRKPPENA